jgi:hypothetical protein
MPKISCDSSLWKIGGKPLPERATRDTSSGVTGRERGRSWFGLYRLGLSPRRLSGCRMWVGSSIQLQLPLPLPLRLPPFVAVL